MLLLLLSMNGLKVIIFNKKDKRVCRILTRVHKILDEAIIPTIVVENTKHKKKREMDERIKEIDREFLDNREV